MHQGKAIWLAVVFMALAGPVAGQQFYGDKKYGEYYEEEKKWIELEAKLPDFPNTRNLIEFDAGAASRNRHFIDGSTLSVGEDGVVRYAVVVKTQGGATNVSFEGIRCGVKLRKLYAFGRSDESWAKSRNPEWQPIRPGSYQAVLSKEYFCPQNLSIFKAEEGVDALRRGGHPESK